MFIKKHGAPKTQEEESFNTKHGDREYSEIQE